MTLIPAALWRRVPLLATGAERIAGDRLEGAVSATGDWIEEVTSERILDMEIRVVDPHWKAGPVPLRGMRAWVNTAERLTVLLSVGAHGGRRWLHFSICGPTLPTWRQLVAAKEAILGRETKAIQVLAPRSQWVNINPNVLHLWSCLDGDPLPDFTAGTGSL
jgi:hypothetical protein